MKRLWAPWRIRFILEHRKEKGCVFCSLPKGENDPQALILKRLDHAFVIMNKYPYNSGHLMVIPFKHTNTLSDLNKAELCDLSLGVQRCTQVLEKALNCQGFNIGMNIGDAGGAGIAEHLHFHIVPRWIGDTNCMPVLAQTKVLPESLDETYNRLVGLF